MGRELTSDPNLPTRLARALGAGRAKPPTAAYTPDLSFGRHRGPPPADARQAAVLVLLYMREGRWHVPLALRPAAMTAHAGQVALPGGRLDPGETVEAAALRELHEELGVPAGEVALLGRLSPAWVYVSNNWVTPCVAACAAMPIFAPQSAEVEEVLEAPLAVLLDVRARGEHLIDRAGLRFRAPHLELAGRRVWGATWMILGELIETLRTLGA